MTRPNDQPAGSPDQTPAANAPVPPGTPFAVATPDSHSSLWLAAVSVGIAWVYYPTLEHLVQIWWRDPQYSHGFLVPAFSVWLLWVRRWRMNWAEAHSSWWGIFALGAGLAIRFAGVYLYVEWFEHVSLLVALCGLALLAGGLKMLAWSGLAIGFLIFMIPFPYRIEISLSDPLQKIATAASCYLLQTFGVLAVSEGNIILLEDSAIEVVQACNGLRMAVSFLALSVATAILVKRHTWERVLIILSAVPIALVSNIFRITVTGYLSTWVSPHAGQLFFHDVGGWLMMPLALCFLALEMWLIRFLLIDPASDGGPRVLFRGQVTGKAAGSTPQR